MSKQDDAHSWCISRNTGSEKYGGTNDSKAAFQKTLRQTTQQMSQNTVAIWTTAPFQYLLITVQVVALEEVSFSDTQTPKVFCEHIDSRWEPLSAY